MIGNAKCLALGLMTGLCAAGGACDGGKSAKPQAAASASQPAGTQTREMPDSRVGSEKIEQSLAAAQDYLNSQDVSKATAILVTLIDRAPREVRARELYGQALTLAALQAAGRGDDPASAALRAKAYEQYRIATQIDPNSAGLQHSAGQIALAAGDATAALDYFRTAGKLDPANPQYPLYEAQPLIQQRRFDEAKAALERVLKLDPDEAFAHASLAMISLEQDQFDEALRHMAEARRIQPADLGMRAQEAKIHRRKGEPKRGLELLVGLSPSERSQEMVTQEIAACHSQLGDHIAAAKAWQTCFQANQARPNGWKAAVHAGEELLKAGQREQAAMWLQQAQIAAPGAPDVQALEAALAK